VVRRDTCYDTSVNQLLGLDSRIKKEIVSRTTSKAVHLRPGLTYEVKFLVSVVVLELRAGILTCKATFMGVLLIHRKRRETKFKF
jgi:hypothetical protein